MTSEHTGSAYVGISGAGKEPDAWFEAVCCPPERGGFVHEKLLEPYLGAVLEYLDQIQMDVGEDARLEVGCLSAGMGRQLYRDLIARGFEARLLEELPTDLEHESPARALALALSQGLQDLRATETEEEMALERYARMRDEQEQVLAQLEGFIAQACEANGWKYPGAPEEHWSDEHLAWLENLDAQGADRYMIEMYVHDIQIVRSRIDRFNDRVAHLKQARERRRRKQDGTRA